MSETEALPKNGVGGPAPSQPARSLRLFSPLFSHLASRTSSLANWLCFRPSTLAMCDLTPSDLVVCVKPKLALFCAFSGPSTPPSPCPSQSAATAPSWDTIPIVSFVESSMTRLESCPTTGPEPPSFIGSLLSPSSQPPVSTTRGDFGFWIGDFGSPGATWHSSSAIWHLPSAIWHLPSAIWHLPSAIWHLPSAIWHLPSAIWHLPSAISPFPIPKSAFRNFRSASSVRCSSRVLADW